MENGNFSRGVIPGVIVGGYLSDANQAIRRLSGTLTPVNTDLGVARRGCSSRLTYGPFNETLMSFESPEEEDRSTCDWIRTFVRKRVREFYREFNIAWNVRMIERFQIFRQSFPDCLLFLKREEKDG